MSGNLPFDLFIGDRLPSSWYKYFSFWRNTLETVLLSTPNMAPISVCLTVGCSSWYRHIRRRSASVNVFRGVDECERVDVADTGVADAGVMGIGVDE